MKNFFAIFVMVSLFASKVVSKDFCEAFKDNNHSIDYGFEYSNRVGSPGALLVIGLDFWQINPFFSNESFIMISNESQSHDVFDGNRYSAAFLDDTHQVNVRNIRNYGFFEKTDSRVKWKRLKVLDPLVIELVNEFHSTDPRLPEGFRTTAIFISSNNHINKETFITFVQQIPDSDNDEYFNRSYVTKLLGLQTVGEQGSNGFSELEPELWRKTDRKKDWFITKLNVWDRRFQMYSYFIYSTKERIEYCVKEWTLPKWNDPDYRNIFLKEDLNENCPNERKILINCKTITPERDPKKGYGIWVIVVIVILCLLALLAVVYYCCTNVRAFRRFMPRDETTIDSTTFIMRSAPTVSQSSRMTSQSTMSSTQKSNKTGTTRSAKPVSTQSSTSGSKPSKSSKPSKTQKSPKK